MSRRWPYLFAAALLVVLVIGWWVFRVLAPSRSLAAAPRSLAADAARLGATPGKWQSKVMKITSRDGKVLNQILGIEFAPSLSGNQSNAPDARAKLFTASPTKGIPPLIEASTSFGDGSFRDVRLRETNGVRTITISRALPPDNRTPEKRQRIIDRYWSVTFPYELKNNVLTLKGFPTTNKVSWGVSEFMVPQEEIQFRNVR